MRLVNFLSFFLVIIIVVFNLRCVDSAATNGVYEQRSNGPEDRAHMFAPLALSEHELSEHELFQQYIRDLPPHLRVTDAADCPLPTEIAPCNCYFYTGYGLGIDCSAVQSRLTLENVFQASFPNTSFYELIIQGQPGACVPVDVLDDQTFGPISFETIQIRNTDIHTVELGTFANSYQTLKEYRITDSEIYFFALEELSSFTSLILLDVSNNQIPFLPEITSPILQTLDFHGNTVLEINGDTFANSPSLRRLMLQNTNIAVLPPNTFSSLFQLEILYLSNNNFTELKALAIAVPSPSLYVLRLEDNVLELVEPGAIQGLAESAQLQLQNTQLQHLQEDVWASVFLQLTSPDAVVYLQYNPLDCGCEIAWLVTNATFMSRLGNLGSDENTCADGTPLPEINVGQLANCTLGA